MDIQRITSGVASTVYSTSTGTIANVNDDNVATSCGITGESGVVYPFWTVDLGENKRVVQAVYKNLTESIGTDTSWFIKYSTTPFNGTAQQGANYGTELQAIDQTPKSGTTIGTTTARYWGIARFGDWGGGVLTLADLNLYEDITSGLDLTSKSW